MRSNYLCIAMLMVTLSTTLGCSVNSGNRCVIAPLENHKGDWEAAAKIGADLANLTKAPLNANLEATLKNKVEDIFQAIPETEVACHMLLSTVACLSEKPRNQSSVQYLLSYIREEDKCGGGIARKSSEDNIRAVHPTDIRHTLHGQVDADGNKVSGEDWSVVPIGVGKYRVTFASGAAFADQPVVVVTPVATNDYGRDDNIVRVGEISSQGFVVYANDGDGPAERNGFTFSAIGRSYNPAKEPANRTSYGQVNAGGNKVSGGDGWTVVREATGKYRVIFAPGTAFADQPTVVATPVATADYGLDDNIVRVGEISPQGFVAYTNDGDGPAERNGFTFSAIGRSHNPVKEPADRTLYGQINVQGNKVSGEDWTVVREAAGKYRINFVSGATFADQPTVVAAPVATDDYGLDDNIVRVAEMSPQGFVVYTNDGDGPAEDTGFTFSVIGRGHSLARVQERADAA